MAAPPRITDAEITAGGGTIDSYIAGLLEILRTSPMEEKEDAAGALHALAIVSEQLGRERSPLQAGVRVGVVHGGWLEHGGVHGG